MKHEISNTPPHPSLQEELLAKLAEGQARQIIQNDLIIDHLTVLNHALISITILATSEAEIEAGFNARTWETLGECVKDLPRTLANLKGKRNLL